MPATTTPTPRFESILPLESRKHLCQGARLQQYIAKCLKLLATRDARTDLARLWPTRHSLLFFAASPSGARVRRQKQRRVDNVIVIGKVQAAAA